MQNLQNLQETELTIFSWAHLMKIREVNEYLEEARKAILKFKRNELSSVIQDIQELTQAFKRFFRRTTQGFQRLLPA